jgi:hypothetical protein
MGKETGKVSGHLFVTITAEGVYWHPVGAEDADLLVTRDIFPLSETFAASVCSL